MTGYVGAQWLNELDVTLGPGVVCPTYHKSWTECGATLLCSVSLGSLINVGDNVHHMYTWTNVGVLRLNVWMKIVLRYASRQVQKGSFDPSSFMICIQEGIGRRQTCIAKIALSLIRTITNLLSEKRSSAYWILSAVEGVTRDWTRVKMLLSLLKQVILGEATVTTMTGPLCNRMTAKHFNQECVQHIYPALI